MKKAEKIEVEKIEEVPVLKEEMLEVKEKEELPKEELPKEEPAAPTGTVPVHEADIELSIEALSNKALEVMGGRPVSEIPLQDPFWELNRKLEKMIKGDN